MAEVVPFKGGTGPSDAKAAWLDQVAQAYDEFVINTKIEPVAKILIFMAGDGVKFSWDMPDPPAGQPWSTSGLILVAAECLRNHAFAITPD